MKKFLLALVIPLLMFSMPKALHLTFHKGCSGEMAYICEKLGVELDTWFLLEQQDQFLDGRDRAPSNYIMTEDRAQRIYNKHKSIFEAYDLIITSDIAPLSRIFLQNNWEKPLLVWVCNRFDINAFRSNLDKFPDKMYYSLFDSIKDRPNIEAVGYAKFERVHAEKNHGISVIQETIEPTGNGKSQPGYRPVSRKIVKKDTLFIRRYRNEIKLKLPRILASLEIPHYMGHYAGSDDLADFKGMIHFPLVMGNLHLWENLKVGLVHFIPSKRFYRELYNARRIEFWDWTNPANKSGMLSADEIFKYCDWYDDRLSPLFVFFDSFEHLKELIEETDYEAKKLLIKEFHQTHTKDCLQKWQTVFSKLI